MDLVISLVLGWGIWLVIDGWRHPQEHVHRRHRASELDGLLARAGLSELSSNRVWMSCGLSFGIAGTAVLLLTAQPALALIAAIAATWTPIVFLRSRAAKRQREHANAWPDAIDHIASAIRAGLSMPEALVGLGERGPQELREPFAAFGRDYQSTGRFLVALDALKARLADPVGDRVVEALRIAREVGGGDIGRMLRTLSAFLREDLRTRAELEARQSWTVSGARLAVAAPWVVLALMSTREDAIAQFTTPTGILLVITGAIVCFVAYRLMLRLGRLPAEKRVLVA